MLEQRGFPGKSHTPMNAVPGTPLSSGWRKRAMRRTDILAELPLWLSVFTLFALAVLF